jgi:diguanylate cyclase (GGDEF)-like protein
MDTFSGVLTEDAKGSETGDMAELELWQAAVTAATGLIGIFSFSEFFDAVASHMANAMEAGGASLIVYDGPDHLRYRLFYGLKELNYQSIAGFRFRANEGTVGRALASGEPLFTADYPNSPDAMPLFVAAGVQANLVLPLRGPHGLLGAMTITWLNRRPKDFKPDRMVVVGMFAALVGSALYREALEEQLKLQSLHDVLTGLPNRRLMMRHLAEALERAKCNQSLVAVGVIDLDGFKQVNDRYGHSAGDLVLIAVADCIKKNLRATDLIARFGGDEFVVILEDVKTVSEIEFILQRIVEAVQLDDSILQHQLQIGASIGAAILPSTALGPEAVLQQADAAMYIAKRNGGGRVFVSPAGPGAMKPEIIPIADQTIPPGDMGVDRSMPLLNGAVASLPNAACLSS